MGMISKPSLVYKRLIWRNRFVAILRFLVPVFGLLIFAFLILKIFLANIGNDYNISGIRIEQDLIVIETPQYSGVMHNGTKYKITSKTATSAIGDGDAFDLSEAKFDMVRIDGLNIIALANRANYNIAKQKIIVKDEMIVIDSRGTKAKLFNSIIDWNTQILHTKDNVEIIFSDGSILKSKTLVFDIEAQTWKFNQVTLSLTSKE